MRFFFNDPPPTEIYTLSLHDALPISDPVDAAPRQPHVAPEPPDGAAAARAAPAGYVGRERLLGPSPHDLAHLRSEEHTSELQSRRDLVCRLLLEKKKNCPT